MTDYTIAILLGIVEGITEFIPISSTAHLILVGDILTFKQATTFHIAIQLGAILAVLCRYRPYFFSLCFNRASFKEHIKIGLTIFPASVLGFFLYDVIKQQLFSPKTVMISLFVGAILMLIAEYSVKRRSVLPQQATASIDAITFKQALYVGLFQCLSLWPGMSRSASTIMGGLFSGLSHRQATHFSFIIAVPIITLAVAYDLFKSATVLTAYDLQLIAIGFLISFVVGYVAIVSFINIIGRWTLIPFAIYRIIVATLLYFIL